MMGRERKSNYLCHKFSLHLMKLFSSHKDVLPYVNKGLALFQWKGDIAAAEQCCREALSIDSECDAAITTLAQLSLQQCKFNEAAALFKTHSELARTEPELIEALTYHYESLSQSEFLKKYPEMGEKLTQTMTTRTKTASHS